jgi:predicted O-methyltransferase YrrM
MKLLRSFIIKNKYNQISFPLNISKAYFINNSMYFKNSNNRKFNDYLYNIGNRVADYKHELREETIKLFNNEAVMLTEISEGELLKMLVQITGAKTAVEIGVFTGYSSICLAEGLPEDGRLLACDVDEDFTNLAKKYWKKGGLEKKITLSLEPGISFLDKLIEKNEVVDIAYLDADKSNYINYYERLLKLMKTGGVIIFDNTLWSGRVLNEDADETTKSIQNLNLFLQKDTRVDINMIPLSDGVTIVRKK